MNEYTITVIIPTLATRVPELNRAIDSVLRQEGVAALPLVVVNGQRGEAALLDDLRGREDIRLVETPKAGVSAARLEGWRYVDTSHFAFLDDDDELLPTGLGESLRALEKHGADVVATNGYRECDGERSLCFQAFSKTDLDPAIALLQENWLSSAGGLYRTDRVGAEYLENLPNYLELTLFAFRLALSLKVHRENIPTFVIHTTADERASESLRYFEAEPEVLRTMEVMTTRKDLRAMLRQKRSRSLHRVSEMALKSGYKKTAWRYHLRSLCLGGGWRFLPFTRHILRA